MGCKIDGALLSLLLQSHYNRIVVPAISPNMVELSSASSALLALLHAVEDSITTVLRKSVDTFIAHVSARGCTTAARGMLGSVQQWHVLLCSMQHAMQECGTCDLPFQANMVASALSVACGLCSVS